MSEFDVILDSSQQNLKEVPSKILEMCNLKMLYLQQNYIKKLPNDFFLRLPSLSWLDLRNNLLTKIPVSVAHHQHLENLLLSDNKIEMLPNELGLVPNLKVLQIANNPLIYPSSKTISSGTRAICSFLKNQYDKEIASMTENKVNPEYMPKEERQEEREIRVIESDNDFLIGEPISSSLVVKGLSRERGDNKIVHKVSQDTLSNKILIRSYFDEDEKYVRASTQTSDYSVISKDTLKQNWMDKLRTLLEEQEKILQQERSFLLTKVVQNVKLDVCRNLQALSSWRYRKKSEPIRSVHREEPRTPYATYPEYDSMLSRQDLVKQIDRLIERNRNQPKQENIEKLINDLLSQLKEMESFYGGIKSPRSEIEAAGNEIIKIMEVHKKLLNLQKLNNKL